LGDAAHGDGWDRCVCFADASSGLSHATGAGKSSKGGDAFAASIGHREGETIIIDLVFERKSTFAEPASATSGLQDYDMDGKKRQPRISMRAPLPGKFKGPSGKTYESSRKGAEIEVEPEDVERMKLHGFAVSKISIRWRAQRKQGKIFDMLTVWVPKDQPTTYEHETIVNGEGKKIIYQARMHAGRLVVDFAPGFFQLLLGSGNGLLWQRNNPRAIDWLGTLAGSNQYFGQPFPDEDSPPPTLVAPPEVAPISVRLRAPAGTSCYSHAGELHEIGTDGLITVDPPVADVLHWHGFTRA
jgi:hypothetical protein